MLLNDDRKRSREVRDEIRFYLEMRAEELERAGMDADEAWRTAVERFGDPGRIEWQIMTEAKMREARGGWGEWIASVARDASVAARSFAREPAFTLVAVTTLALGIGATSAIVSVADQALLAGPPVRDPGDLVAVYTTSRRGFPRSATSYPDFEDYRDRTGSLDDLAATALQSVALGDERAGAELFVGQLVTGNFFGVLGLAPGEGRLLGPGDDRRGSGEAVVVISDALWRDRFAADTAVVGSTVRLDGRPYEVVGVAPRDFRGLRLGSRVDLWIPMQSRPFLDGDPAAADVFDQRTARWIDLLVGRVAPGADARRAYTELFSVSEALRDADPDARGPRSVTVDPLARYIPPSGFEADFRLFVTLLVGTVMLALALCCANIANLLLARASGRARDSSVRMAIGAGRARLVRQLLTESLVLAVLGGSAGLAVASGALSVLRRFDLPGGVGVASLGVRLDPGVVAVTAVLALGSGFLFGVAPALSVGRTGLAGALRSGGRVASPSTGARKLLVAAQVALCVVLLVGSGLFVRTLDEGFSTDLGFAPDGLALARFTLGFGAWEPEVAIRSVATLEDHVRALPGVTAVSVATRVPLFGGGARGYFFTVVGYEPAPDEELRVDAVFATPGYASALGLPVATGRDLAEGDGVDGLRVVVVSRAMAEKYWPDGGAVGGTVNLSGTPLRVVGVVENATWNGLADDVTNYMYLPLAISPSVAASGPLTLLARTDGDAKALAGAVRARITELDRTATISAAGTMAESVGGVLMPQRMGAMLLTAFGLLALTLSSVGIAGVVAYTVGRRRREIGLRVALGASGKTVLGGLLWSMTTPVLAGVAAGVAIALGLSGAVEALLFGVRPTDPLTYLVIALVVTGIAIAAVLVPARAALRVEPSRVLGTE